MRYDGSAGAAPKQIGHIASLNGVRALSVAVVFWAHAGLPGGVRGGAGVTVFFFLSGFLITTLLRFEYDRFARISLKDFYIRRVLRIMPPMYIALIVGCGLTLAGLLASSLEVGGILSSMFFFINYWIIGGGEGFPDGLGVLWSLAVEEHYYVLFPLLYVVLRKWLPRRHHQALVLAVICVAILAWRVWLVYGNGVDTVRVYYATDTRADGILLGAIFAIVWNPVYGEVSSRLQRLLPWLTLVSALVFVPFMVPRFTEDIVVYSWGVTLQSLCLVPVFAWIILSPNTWVGRVLNWKPVDFIGVLSYSIYLFHSMFLHVFEKSDLLPRGVAIIVAAVSAILAAYLVHIFVERPIARARKRRARSK